jgi:hypothetical protein
MTIAHFQFVRTLEGFDFEAQPSIDLGKFRDLAPIAGSPTATTWCCWVHQCGQD